MHARRGTLSRRCRAQVELRHVPRKEGSRLQAKCPSAQYKRMHSFRALNGVSFRGSLPPSLPACVYLNL